MGFLLIAYSELCIFPEKKCLQIFLLWIYSSLKAEKFCGDTELSFCLWGLTMVLLKVVQNFHIDKNVDSL